MPQKPKREKATVKHAHAPASEIAALSQPASGKSSITPTAEAKAGQAAGTATQPRVDGWFDRQLVDLYGEVADEPVPSELLALINQLKDPN